MNKNGRKANTQTIGRGVPIDTVLKYDEDCNSKNRIYELLISFEYMVNLRSFF